MVLDAARFRSLYRECILFSWKVKTRRDKWKFMNNSVLLFWSSTGWEKLRIKKKTKTKVMTKEYRKIDFFFTLYRWGWYVQLVSGWYINVVQAWPDQMPDRRTRKKCRCGRPPSGHFGVNRRGENLRIDRIFLTRPTGRLYRPQRSRTWWSVVQHWDQPVMSFACSEGTWRHLLQVRALYGTPFQFAFGMTCHGPQLCDGWGEGDVEDILWASYTVWLASIIEN